MFKKGDKVVKILSGPRGTEMRKVLPLMLAALTTTSCENSPGNHFDIVLDKSVDQETWRDLDIAISEWETAAPAISFSVYVDPVYPSDMRNRISLYRVHNHPDWRGLSAYQPGIGRSQIWIADHGVFSDVIAHELGHAMGLAHKMCGVMFPDETDVVMHVQCCDVEQLCTVRGFDESWCHCHQSLDAGENSDGAVVP